jgi:hypothetical protein
MIELSNWLYNWQTLIGGGLALLGAVITVLALNRQTQQATLRKSRALRAMLPNTLSAIDAYAIETIRWLKSVREKAGLLERGQYGNQSIAVMSAPRMDNAAVTFLQDCVEHFDRGPSAFVAKLLSKQQVHNSRIMDLHDYFVHYPLYEVKQIGLQKNITEFIASAVDLAAYARQLYPYARLETEATPSVPNADVAMQAFYHCHLRPEQDTDAWNTLTNRYPETAAAGAYKPLEG